MRYRCRNPHSDSYKYYGERNIKVCDEWDKNYLSFRTWAIENGYKDGLTIDRIDVNGDYCPENCRWATIKEQNRNKRDNVKITYKGETHNASEWSEIIGIPGYVIRNRLKYGWDIEKIMETPVRKHNKNMTQ